MFAETESEQALHTSKYTTAEKLKLAGISNNANKYTLPTARSSTLGGVKVGSGLSISNGVLSVSGGGLQVIAEGTLSSSSWGGDRSVTFDKAAIFVIVSVSSFTHPGGGICLPGQSCMVSEAGSGSTGASVELSSNGTQLYIYGDRGQSTNYIAIG